eukprot:3677257-Rhodomonas_salina.2
MAARYSNMAAEEEDGPPQQPGSVGTDIEEGEGEEEFLDLVDDFEGMDEDEMDADVSFVSNGAENEDDDLFDMTVGALEDIMMDDAFQKMQNDFAAQHCSVFEDTDENKLIYTDIFKKYTEMIETYVEEKLQETIRGFSMQTFTQSLIEREEEMNASDVFDMLVSCSDFETFKEIMLSHKYQREGGGVQLQLDVRMVHVHKEEQEEGEERPDLNLDILPVPSPNRAGPHFGN